jgi:hypothetical protein
MNPKALGIGLLSAIAVIGLVVTGVAGVSLPTQASPTAVGATQQTSGATVTGHPNATVNGVPPGPPVWLNASAPFGPPVWVNTSGGPPTWLKLP